MRDRLAERPSQLPADRGRWNDGRNRWNDWHRSHYHDHHHWYHGSWYGSWRPARYWDYWWRNYPALTTFGVTTWGINRVGWAFGYYRYDNPYAAGTVIVDNRAYDYSQPIIMTPDEQTLAGDPNDTAPPPDVPPEALSAFDAARQEFFAGDYEASLQSTERALRELPNDTAIHEFRALVLFAVGKYQDSATTLYAVLSVGPGWDWTTKSGLYPSVDVYTGQLRTLEAHCRQNPWDPAGLFVLAYQYMTDGHDDAAARELSMLLAIQPDDSLAAQLLLELDPDADIPNPPKQVEPPKPDRKVDEAQLQGRWTATRDSGTFDMTLNADGTFSWAYAADGDKQTVTGVWEVDDEGILVLEMNDEGVLLAQVVPANGTMDFYMLGDTQGAPPLTFSRSR